MILFGVSSDNFFILGYFHFFDTDFLVFNLGIRLTYNLQLITHNEFIFISCRLLVVGYGLVTPA